MQLFEGATEIQKAFFYMVEIERLRQILSQFLDFVSFDQ
jgi:hypothetical protein